jgi:CBS domain-containing protein
MKTVQEMIDRKGRGVVTIGSEATVFDAVAAMTEHNVGALVVTCGDDGRVCGVISERDYLRHVVLEGRTSRSTPVSEIMTREVVYAEPSCTAEEALAIMTEKRFRHLPVMVDGALGGIVSIGDCVKAVIKEQEVEIKYLKEYISDGYPGPGKSTKGGA